MSKRSRSQYIDDRADVDPNGEADDDTSDEDDDSTDAQLRREDRARYNMPAIEEGHVARLRAAAPYRIPTEFLEGGGAATPARNDDYFPDMPSRPTSPAAAWAAPPPQMGSRGPTPYADPNYNFFPDADSRGPTPHVDNRQDSARHTSPTPPPSPSSERPAKKQRIEGPGYLDLAAEDSDDPDGDDEDEDEETMSDRDFLDDDDTGQQKIVSRPQLIDDEEDNGVHALATRYELAAPEYEREAAREATRGDGRRFLANADVVPGTWPVLRPYRSPLSRSAFHFDDQTLPAPHPSPLPTLISKNLKKPKTLQEWIEVDTGIVMKQNMFPACTPTADELAPFTDSPHPNLDQITWAAPAPALAEGDCVVVVSGTHKGETGVIIVLREIMGARWAKVVPKYDGTASFEKDVRGIYLKVQHLMRHGLDAPAQLRIHDRVVTISVNADVSVVGPSEMSANRQICQIQVACVMRYIKPGDLVRVLRGEHKGQVGFVVALRTGGSIEIFDPQAHRPDGFNPTMELTTSPGFIVRAADVDFEHDVSGMTIENEGSTSYTPASIVAHVQSPSKPSKLGEVPQKEKDRMPSVQDMFRNLGPNAPANNKNPYEMYNDALQPWMGVDTRESAESVLEPEHGTDNWDNQDGVVIVIRHEISNHTVSVPIQFVYHEYTSYPLAKARWLPRDVIMGRVEPRRKPGDIQQRGSFPVEKPKQRASTPPLPPSADSAADLAWGESTGLWMCVPGLAKKRVDVKIVGVVKLPKAVSKTILALEGKTGYLLPDAPISASAKKVTVYAVGKNGTKHDIDISCIKPLREDEGGRKLRD
ncbi:hypothetical protein B0H19DRAFT_1276340 [Mycena capillaripes]|nr:hypothetical protein B0H19DRAFT_1276340 [Mycena capillaripes]